MMQFITLTDYLLLPFYIGIIYIIAGNIRKSKYPPGHPWRPYFMPALTLKVIGAIFIALIYQYYYKAGDTLYYFYQSRILNSALSESPLKWFNLLFHIPDWYSGEYSEYISQMEFYRALNGYVVVSISAFLSMFTFNSFLCTSVLFAAISFTGVWALFRTFASQYPKFSGQVATAALFIPSTFIWGSGIFKDTLCMFALGWLTYGVFQMLVQRNFKPANIVMSILAFYLIAVVKIYILLAFIPALALWVLFMYSHKISSSFIRFFIKVALAGSTVGGFVLLSDQFADELGGYSLQNIAATAETTRGYIYGESLRNEMSSGYDLGAIDPSAAGMLKKAPIAIATTLYRPFPWEAKKAIVFANAIEAFLFLVLTLKLLVMLGPVKVWKTISNDANIQFMLVFTLIFAFAVGLTSGNFGALSRYRIPCLPFYGLSLMLIFYKNETRGRKFIGL